MAANTIGGVIVLGGEREYRTALKGIASEQRELKSEMKLCSSEFKETQNSMEALEEKSIILSKQYDTQSRKVELYSKAVEESGQKQEESKRKLENLTSEYEDAERALQDLTQETNASEESIEAQRRTVTELETELRSAQRGFDGARDSTQRWQTNLNNANAELVDINRVIERNDTHLNEARESTDRCATSIDEYGRHVSDASDESEEFGRTSSEGIDMLANALVAAGIAKSVEEIAKVLIACTENSKEFQVVISKISTVADIQKISMSEMKTQILELSNELGIATGIIGESTYNAISAAVDSASAVAFVGDATKLAIGGFTDTTTTVDLLTTSLNAYKLGIEETSAVSDMLVMTQNLGKTTVGELASSMGNVIPIASAYNVEMNNLTSAYATLTINGIKTAEATTYLKGMFNELGDSGSAVGGILLEKTGKSFGTLMQTGSSLGDVIDILGKSVDYDNAAFNGLWSSSEAGVGALTILGVGAEKFNGTLQTMNDSAGATEEAFNKMSNTTEHAENKFRTSTENLKTAIGDELMPALEDLYEIGEDSFLWATDFVEENPEIVSAVVALTTAMAVLVGGLALATAAVIALDVATKVLSAHPIILLVTAIVGAGIALGTLILIQESATTSTEDLIKKQQEEMQILEDEIIARKEATKETENEIVELNELKNTIVVLSEKEKLNISEKADMLVAVDKLNEAMPELNLQIDENTGKLKGNTEELEKNIDEQLKAYEVAFMQEELTAVAHEHYEAKKLLNEIKEEEILLQDEINKSEEEYNSWLEKNTEAIEKSIKTGEYSSLMAEEFRITNESMKAGLVESKEALDDMGISSEEAGNAVSVLKEEYEVLKESTDEAKEATKEIADTTVEYKDVIYSTTAEVVASVEGIKGAYQEAKAEAMDSLKSQVSLFEELSVESDLSASKMADNLASQTETYETYTADLITAQELMKNDTTGNMSAIVQSIMDMGIDGAGYLNEFVAASEGSGVEFAAIMENYGDMEEAREKQTEIMGDITAGYTTQMDSVLEIHSEKYLEIELVTTESAEKNLETVTLSNEDMKEATEKGVEDIATVFKTKTKEVVLASTNMFDEVLKGMDIKLGLTEDGNYSTFLKVGTRIDTSIAKGITDNGHLIKDAMQSAIDKASSSLNFDKLTSSVDRALGEAF